MGQLAHLQQLAAMDRYRLSRREQERRWGGRVLAIPVKEQSRYKELFSGIGDGLMESLWFRREACEEDIMKRGYYRHTIRVNMWMKPSSKHWRKPLKHRTWFLSGSLTSLTCAGKAARWHTSSPGGFWRALGITSCKTYWVSHPGLTYSYIYYSVTRENKLGMWALAAALAVVTMKW